MEFAAAPAPLSLAYRLQDVLQSRISEFDSWVGAAATAFETKLPIPPSCDLFNSEGFFRLKGHQRSICFAPQGREPLRNVLCIKGMEPVAPDFDAALERMASHSADGRLSNLEHFILVEDKLPGCLLLGEAHAEAAIAAMVHRRLADDDGALARLPLPIFCGRHPDAVAETAARAISARASRRVWQKIEMLAAAGLGVYVYWYPSVPLRAWGCRAKGEAAAIMSDGWMNLAARLLCAGFLPTTAHSFGRGQCCDPQNAVVDGGFADVDSIVPISEVRTRQDLFVAVHATIREIAASILHVLGKDNPAAASFGYSRQMTRQVVWQRLAQACGEHADPRLMQFFDAGNSVSSMVQSMDQA